MPPVKKPSKAEAATDEVAAEPAVKTVAWRDQQFELPASLSFGAARQIARIQTATTDVGPDMLFAFLEKVIGADSTQQIEQDVDPMPFEDGIKEIDGLLSSIIEQYGTSPEN